MKRDNKDRHGFSRNRKTSGKKVLIRFLIISEDEKSSSIYIKDLIESVKEYNKDCIISAEIKGCAKGTVKLLEEAKEMKKEIERRKGITFDRCWLVFDKDNFTADSFNEAIKDGKEHGFQVAWSNLCFELWYLLHFSDYDKKEVIPKEYEVDLEKKVRKFIPKFTYKKGRSKMYAILSKHGDQQQALVRAKKLRETHQMNHQNTNYSSHNPCTCVDLLIKEITDPEERKKILKESSSKASVK